VGTQPGIERRDYPMTDPKQVVLDEHKTAGTADRPHHWTVYLSIAAIFISLCGILLSGFSLYESHLARKLNESTSRAAVEISAIKLASSWRWDHNGDPPDIPIEVTINNSGRSMARGIEMTFILFAVVEVSGPGKLKTVISVSMGEAKILPDDLGPGSLATYNVTIDMKQGKGLDDKNPVHRGELVGWTLSPSIKYRDVSTETAYSSASCFRLAADKNGIPGPSVIPHCAVTGRATVLMPMPDGSKKEFSVTAQ
jgi:hypothetical protein